MLAVPATDLIHQPDLSSRSQSFGGNVWSGGFQDVKLIVVPGCGGEDHPGTDTVDPHPLAGPLH